MKIRSNGGLASARLWLAALLFAAAACGDRQLATAPSVEVYRDPTKPIEARVDDLLRRLTLEEKVEQMHGLQSQFIQGVYHTPDNERLGIPGFRMVDGPRGVSAFTGHTTAFPVGAARGASFDPELERRIGRAIGLEARAKGANVILAPVVNLLRQPQWGRAQETYGEDSFLLGEMGVGFVRGAQESVVASVKHYAMNSIEDTRYDVSVEADERTLREVYLPHFKKAVDAGVGSVMSAYNRVRGVYCSENAHLLHDILKGEWGFDGFVESDWSVAVRSTAPSANAGLDIEMPAAVYYGDKLIAAVNAGEVDESTIDEAVRRILRVKFRFGIFDGLPPVDPAVVESDEHRALALDAEREAIVLLRNEGGALPVDRAATKTLAAVGKLVDTANLGDIGSSLVTPTNPVTVLQGLRSRAGGVGIVSVPTNTPSAADLDAIAAADAAIVVVGLTAPDEGEIVISNGVTIGGDRKSLDLHPDQLALIQAVSARQKRTIVVIEGSGAVIVEPFADVVSAILLAFYPGVEGGNAIADVLFGDVNPSGKLPVSFARSADQLPPFDHTSAQVLYDDDPGYRYLDRHGFEPRYPFGFGGSYTRFALQNLALDQAAIRPDGAIRAHVDVTNAGDRPGDEVVQLYVSHPASRVRRAVRALKAFQRVHLAAGETATVSLEVPAQELAYWDEASSAFVVEAESVHVEVGTSSRDLPLAADVAVGGS